MNEIYRICPKCNTEILYKTASQKNRAEKQNSTCVICRNRNIAKKRKYSGTLEKICIICNKITRFSSVTHYKNSKSDLEYMCKSCAVRLTHTDKVISNITRAKMSNSRIGVVMSDETKNKISIKNSGVNNPMYGRTGDKAPMYGKSGKLSPTYGSIPWNKNKKMDSWMICKMRLAAIKRLKLGENGKMLPSYNPIACRLIEIYGKDNDYNFQHAENGGEYYIEELGYWVDGYDKEKNIVIEVDEKHHFDINGELRIKDVNRQKEIEEFLKCKFIRIKLIKN